MNDFNSAREKSGSTKQDWSQSRCLIKGKVSIMMVESKNLEVKVRNGVLTNVYKLYNLCIYLLTNYLRPAEAGDVLYGHHCFLSPLKDPIRSNPSNPFNPIHPIHPIQSNPIQSCFSARTFQHLWRGLLTGQLWLSLSEFVLCADHNWFLHCFPRSAELLKFTSSVSENK